MRGLPHQTLLHLYSCGSLVSALIAMRFSALCEELCLLRGETLTVFLRMMLFIQLILADYQLEYTTKPMSPFNFIQIVHVLAALSCITQV